MIHVRYKGRSIDLHEKELGLGWNASDREIRQRVSKALDVRPSRLADYVIDRTKSGDLIVRPEAVYG